MSSANVLAAEIRRRLGPLPERDEWPLVSIVVLNRDGSDHLRRLLSGLVERTEYPDIELILVDNASSDDSLEFVRAVQAPFPISIVANAHNESFSDGCNQGAELATGELLLFLNNDVEPFEPGWLHELVASLARSGAGAVGATLIGPMPGIEPSHFAIHQRGLIGRQGNGLPTTGFCDYGGDPLGERLGEDIEVSAVAAACLLIRCRAFDAVGGFSHGYMYGPEDVDLALKLRAAGLHIVCSGRSLVIHRINSTLNTLEPGVRAAWTHANRRLFWERWGPRLHRELELDRLEGRGLWIEPDQARPSDAAGGDRTDPPAARAEIEHLAFCLKGGDPRGASDENGQLELLDALGQALHRRGRRSLTLWRAEVGDLRGLDRDVAIHLHGPARFVPVAAQLNVLWIPSEDASPSAIERSRYDLVLDGPRDRDPAQLDLFAASLIAAVDAHAEAVDFPRRISPSPSSNSTHTH